MNGYFSVTRGTAACAVAVAATLLNCNSSAQLFIAADYATNSIYAPGWTEVFGPNDRGQNGGYGFGPWSMWHQVGPNHTNLTAMDRTSPYDPFQTAWTLCNPYLSQAGRALPNGEVWDPVNGYYAPGAGLQIGETFTTVISNPTDRAPYGGYTVSLQNWPENRVNNHSEDVAAVGTFEYYGSLGRWYTPATYADYSSRPFADLDTTTNGMQIDITVTGTNTYHLVLTPLGNPTNAFSEEGTFAHPGPIVWVTYELYNTDSNFYPPGGDYSGCGGPDRTDFYIKSMTVSGVTLNIQQVGTDVLLSWMGALTNFALVSSSNLGPSAVWNPVSPPPSIVNGQNVVTNSIPDAVHRFYRLQFQQ